MKHLPILAMIITGLHSGMAQSFDYKKWLFPDVDRKALDGDFFINGSLNTYDESSLINIFPPNRSALSNRLQLYYNRFYNTRRIQKTEDFISLNNIDKRKYGFKNNIITETSLDSYFAYLNNTRVYNTSGNYIGYLPEGNISYSNNYNNVTDNLKNLSVGLAFGIELGTGRIEPIADLFNAQFLMDDLIQSGVISEKFTEEKLFELGALMAVNRNQRILDFRRLRVQQLQNLNEWLMSQNEISQANTILLSTILTDNWIYNFYNLRGKGFRKSVRLTPEANFRRNFNSSFNSDYTRQSYKFDLSSELYYTQPISQRSQLESVFLLGSNVRKSNYSNDIFSSTKWEPTFYSTAALKYGYFPNSRTIVSVITSLRGIYQKTDLQLNNYMYTFQPALSCNFDYFLSYQLRLNAGINYAYNFNSNVTYPFQNLDRYEHEIFRQSNIQYLAFLIGRKSELSTQVRLTYAFF